MKVLGILFFLVGTLLADDPEFQEMRKWGLDKKISFVQSFPKENRSQKWHKGMRALQYHFAERYSVQWQNNPGGLSEIRQKLEGIRPLLMELGYSDNEPNRGYAAEIGKYLKIDDEVRDMFYDILEKSFEETGQSKNSSLNALFGYGLETEELKKELVSGLSLDSEIAKKSRFGLKALGRAGSWGLVEAVNPLMDLIEFEYSKTGKANRSALKSLRELGPAAIEVLPRIKALYEKRKKDGDADFREIESLEYAIQRISAKPEPRQTSQHKRPRGDSPDRPSPGKHDLATEKADAPIAVASGLKNKWPIMLAVVLVLGAALVWLKAKSRA